MQNLISVKHRLCAAVVFALSAMPLTAHAGWDESTLGDLSDLHNAPTAVPFVAGVNLVTGRMGAVPTGGLDADIFTFTVPVGSTLTAIDLVSFAPDGPDGSGSFLALSAGTSIDSGDSNNHLSNLLVSVPGPLLPLMANPTFGGTGVFGPLEPGDYTFWFQETATTVSYQFSFTLTPIPEPSLLGAIALGAPLMIRRRSW